jgi:hypothetical protein
MMLPDGEELLALEVQSRHVGSGIKGTDLIGSWRLHEVWSKGEMNPAQTNSALLRTLQASLSISHAGESKFLLKNSVSFAGLQLCFSGPGRLLQRRPLLWFHFDKVEASVAGRTFFSASLPLPKHGREPFFALIGCQQTESGTIWLAARGRGGGLAVWVLPNGRVA